MNCGSSYLQPTAETNHRRPPVPVYRVAAGDGQADRPAVPAPRPLPASGTRGSPPHRRTLGLNITGTQCTVYLCIIYVHGRSDWPSFAPWPISASRKRAVLRIPDVYSRSRDQKDPGSWILIRNIAYKYISPIKVLISQKYDKRFSHQIFSIPDTGSRIWRHVSKKHSIPDPQYWKRGTSIHHAADFRTTKRRELYLFIAYVLHPIKIRKRPYQ